MEGAAGDQTLRSYTSPNASPKKFFTSRCAKGLALLIDKNDGDVHTEDEAMNKFLRHLFELSPTTPHAILSSELSGRSYPISLRSLQELLQKRLADIERRDGKESRDTIRADANMGRLGPKVVKMDRESACGLCHFTSGDLEMESHSNFSSARANACAYSGKWMFEVVLGTGGVQQIGWSTLECRFSNENGVGDSADSYAYDGARVKRWNKTRPAAYGQHWLPGDVIGVCIDLPVQPSPVATENGEGLESEEKNKAVDVDSLPESGETPSQESQDGTAEKQSEEASEKRDAEEAIEEDDSEEEEEEELYGTISFYRNGEPLGPAFQKVRTGTGLAYFPTISLSHRERSLLNFGSKPFYFPVPGFQPIQQQPTSIKLKKADYLFECLERLICHSVSAALSSPATSSSSSTSTSSPHSPSLYQFVLPQEDVTILAAKILENLAEYLADDYIIVSSFIPFLVRLLEEDTTTHENGNHHARISYNGERAVAKLLDLMAICLEPFELVPCIDATIHHLTVKARCELPGGFEHLPKDPSDVKSSKGPYAKWAPSEYIHSVKLLVNLLKSSHVMNVFIYHPQVNDLLEAMFTSKQPTMGDLVHVFPSVHWEGSLEDGKSVSKEKYEERLGQMKALVEEHDELLVKLCSLFLGDDTPNVSQWRDEGRKVRHSRRRRISLTPHEERERKSPQGIFLEFLKLIVDKNSAFNRDPPPPGLSDNSTLASLYFALLGTLEDYLAASTRTAARFPVGFFCGKHLDAFDLTRLGGLMGHLRKNYPVKLVDLKKKRIAKRTNRKAGGERRKDSKDRTVSRHGHPEENGLVHAEVEEEISEESIESAEPPLEVIALNSAITFFRYIMGVMFKAAAIQMQNRLQAIALLEDMDARIAKAKSEGSTEEADHLQNARGVYLEDAIESVRLTAWAQSTLFSATKEKRMYDLVIFLVRLFRNISDETPEAFPYIPQMYLETSIEAFHSLRRADPPYDLLQESNREGMQEVLTFLITHFPDARIINPDTRDSLLQSISVLLQQPNFVQHLEANPIAREQLLPMMIAAFDNRNWATVATMFPRLLKGKGFAQDAKAKEGDNEPSEVFAALLRQFYESDKADGGNVMSEFINKLFNNLNWTVSELEVAMRNLIQSTQNVFAYEEETQTLQRRCSIMFELSVSLLRMVEAISLETPRAILDEELNIARICELLLYVVSRTTTGPNASIFESVTSLDIMRVGRVSQITRFAILAPVVGILLNLHRPRTTGTEPPKYDVIDTLLATAQFTMETLDYIAGLAWSAELSPARVDDELRRLDGFMQDLKNRDAEKKDKEINTSQSADEEGELCPICYADVINTTFLPCKHQSCKRCIQRHMLQSKTCFFCKADVASLEFA